MMLNDTTLTSLSPDSMGLECYEKSCKYMGCVCVSKCTYYILVHVGAAAAGEKGWVKWNIKQRVWRGINILSVSHFAGLTTVKQLCQSQGSTAAEQMERCFCRRSDCVFGAERLTQFEHTAPQICIQRQMVNYRNNNTYK